MSSQNGRAGAVIDRSAPGPAWLAVLAATLRPAALLAAGVVFLLRYAAHPARPTVGGDLGWLRWFGQQRYFGAAAAWLRGDLSPGLFRMYPRAGGFLLVPLRPLPSGPAVLDLVDGVRADPAVTSLYVRQTLHYGVPCWLPVPIRSCAPPAPEHRVAMAPP